jgi:3-oxoacyl-[acyl-carrier protein] reductase
LIKGRTLSGRTALITGASRGIGRASALRLARDGAAIAVNYVQSARQAHDVTAEISRSGGTAAAFNADVAALEEARRLVSEVRAKLGLIDILVCNAGRLVAGDLEDYDPAASAAMWNLHVGAVAFLADAVREDMRRREYGRIVVVGSIAGLGTSFPGNSFYGATKAAAMLLTRRLALELGPLGITANAIAPGFIETDMAHSVRGTTRLLPLLTG